jgi:drug/metabolite transporter (DMT)-like permease
MTAAADTRPLAGILWMLVTGLCFTAVNVIVKWVGQSVPAAEAVFLRYLTGLVFLVPMLPAMLRAGFGPRLLGGYAVRGGFHTIGALAWFVAMASIPMAEVTALGYTQPVYITLMAVLFLGERIALRRVLAILCALAGALIVLRPGFRELSTGHIAMLISAPGFAISYVMAKKLTETTSPAATVGWMSVMVTIFLAPFAWAVWQPPTWTELFWLFVTAGFATTAHYTMMLAFRAAPITLLQPVTFLQLIWSVSFGALLFGEPADGWVVLGGTVILGAVVFIAWREARLRRAPPDPL